MTDIANTEVANTSTEPSPEVSGEALGAAERRAERNATFDAWQRDSSRQWDREASQSRQALRDTLEKTVGAEVAERNAVNSGWEGSNDDADWLMSRFGDRAGHWLNRMVFFDAEIGKARTARDVNRTVALRDQLLREWFAEQPHFGEVRTKKNEGKTISDSFKRAEQELKRRELFAPLVQQYGTNIGKMITAARRLVEGGLDKNANYATAAIAAANGTPVLPEDLQALEQQEAQAQYQGQIESEIGQYIAAGRWPGFDQVADHVAALLEGGHIPQYQTKLEMLDHAYLTAIEYARQQNIRRVQEAAKKSITGSPAPGIERNTIAGAVSARQALKNRMGELAR